MFAPQTSTSSTNLGFYWFFFFQRKKFIRTPLPEIHKCQPFTSCNKVSRSFIYPFMLFCCVFPKLSSALDLQFQKGCGKGPFSLCLSRGLGHMYDVGVGCRERRTPNCTKNSLLLSQGAVADPHQVSITSLRMSSSPGGSPVPRVHAHCHQSCLASKLLRLEVKRRWVAVMQWEPKRKKKDTSEQEGGNDKALCLIVTGDEREDRVKDNTVKHSLTILGSIRATLSVPRKKKVCRGLIRECNISICTPENKEWQWSKYGGDDTDLECVSRI